jgi:elongation factor P hydroxylase
MLTFVKIGDLLLMSFMKFFHMFFKLSSMRLSQFDFDTEQFVPDGFQECSQRGHKQKNCKKQLMNWLNGLAAHFYDRSSIITTVLALDDDHNNQNM